MPDLSTTPLHTEWMTALGFTLVPPHPRLSSRQWVHTALRLQVSDAMDPATVLAIYNRGLINQTVGNYQHTLREALLPAMGMELVEDDTEQDSTGRYRYSVKLT